MVKVMTAYHNQSENEFLKTTTADISATGGGVCKPRVCGGTHLQRALLVASLLRGFGVGYCVMGPDATQAFVFSYFFPNTGSSVLYTLVLVQ